MAKRKKHHAKTFQQRQSERRLAHDKDRALVEDTARKFTCSNAVARDFAEQCELRIDDLDFDLICSDLALEFWAAPPEPALHIVDLIRELADERRRHRAALGSLAQRLYATTRDATVHHHLGLPIEHYEQRVRDTILPGPDPRPVQNPAISGDR
jgi:hypothetical protein